MLPQTLKKYFWDAPFDTIDVKRNRGYVMARLLEMGDESAVAWLRQTYRVADLKEIVNRSRNLSPKSRNYWRLIFEHA